jgi:hypothetical protein
MNKILKNIITYSIVLILAGVVVKVVAVDMLWAKARGLVEQVDILTKANKDKDVVIETANSRISSLTTTNTELFEKLAEENKLYQGFKDSLKTLNEQLVTLRQGSGEVSVVDSVVGTVKYDTATFKDDWLDVKYAILTNTFTYKWNFEILLEGFETKDKYNNRQSIENVFIKSMRTGRLLPVRWNSEYASLKPEHTLWRWWNPKLHSDVLFANPIKFGGSVNIMSFGVDKYIETTTLYVVCFGMSSDFDDKVEITVFPVKVNIGQFIPIISNLNVGAGVGWDLSDQKLVIQFGIGMVH